MRLEIHLGTQIRSFPKKKKSVVNNILVRTKVFEMYTRVSTAKEIQNPS